MTDRELLEQAAKAAGLDGEWSEAYKSFHINTAPLRNFVLWNPLTDDGDALRLAVKLGLCVIRETIRKPIVSVVCNLKTFNQLTAYRLAWEPLTENDPYAATRRAIVRAAAEIGEKK